MVKTVLKQAGLSTALVVIGWVSFLAGQITDVPIVSVPLMAIARVLP